MARTLPQWITSADPTDRQGIGSRAIPQGGADAPLSRSLSLARPVQPELLPDRFRVREDRLQSGQAEADDAGTANGVPGAFWRGRDASTASHRPVVTSVTRLGLCMQTPFQHKGSCLTHQLERPAGKPSTNQVDHLRCPHPDRLVPLAQPFTHAQRVVARTPKNGHAHGCFVQRRVTTTAITIQRRPGRLDFPRATGKRTLTGLAPCADRAAPASFGRFITHQIDTSVCWYQRLDHEKQEVATHRSGRPVGQARAPEERGSS